MRKIILSFLVLVVSASAIAIATKAAFEDQGKVAGSTFSVGSIDIKLLDNLSGSVSEENLLDQKPGPIFSNLYPGWSKDYVLKLYNDGSLNMTVDSSSSYVTADDPSTLRDYIYVEVFDWNDTNLDGVADSGEVNETALSKKTILKWKTEGIPIGVISAGDVKGLLLRFTSASLPDSKQGQTAKYDFEFTGTTDGVTQE